jgi:biotin-dependent carboxylase-like uncharacterized protein
LPTSFEACWLAKESQLGASSDVGLIVVNPGVHTTVQDLGRAGYREWGVPPAGAFDVRSHRLANALLGNAPGAASLEMTLVGGTYEADQPLALALAGANGDARIEKHGEAAIALRMPQSLTLNAGERLYIGGMARGARNYLAVSGGWQTQAVLGSRSCEVPLRAGEYLPCAPGTTAVRRPAKSDPCGSEAGVIQIVFGPDAAALRTDDPWQGAIYRVGKDASRMGLRLEGPGIEVEADPERLSAAVLTGAIQIAGAQPIVLGVACGTLGGYPHVAQVVSADLWRLGQLRPGAEIRFQRISLETARERDRIERRLWDEHLDLIALAGTDPGR